MSTEDITAVKIFVARLEERQEQSTKRIEERISSLCTAVNEHTAVASAAISKHADKIDQHTTSIDRLEQRGKIVSWLVGVFGAASTTAGVHAIVDWFKGR